MYLWWRMWHDENRKLWVERFVNGDPKTSKQAHADDIRFGWASGLVAPSVSSLEFTDENNHTKTVASGASRNLPQDDAYYARTVEPERPPVDDGLPF